MSDNILTEMDLPLSNPKVELETISRDKLRPLFKSNEFILRDEEVRDNGIDLAGEILFNGKVTNFRFVIQLKATERINFNKDNSFSLSLYTSNINYLLNNGMPAYYILYSKERDSFYYQNINSFVKELNEKNINWNEQKTHTLRFQKELNIESINEIFETTKIRGLLQRKITEKHIVLTSLIDSNPKDRIHIDQELNVTDDREIRKIIENIGFELLNKAQWKKVIELHNNTSRNLNLTSLYNLILGVCHYYSGNLIEGYSFLKEAKKKSIELKKDLNEYLQYFLLSSKYSLGFINQELYQSEISKIDSKSFFYSYTQLEKLRYDFSSTTLNYEESYNKLITGINNLILNSKNDHNLVISAKMELLYFKGSHVNITFFQRICHINAHPLLFENNQRINEANIFIENCKNINNDFHKIQKEALEAKNLFNYHLSITNNIRFNYELDFMSNYLINNTTEKFIIKDSGKKVFEAYIKQLEETILFYKNIGHIENLNVSLSIKYELLKYIGKEEEIEDIKQEIKSNIEIYELNEQKKRFEFLINKGTKHEAFNQFIDDIYKKTQEKILKYEEMREELKSMDYSDLNSEKQEYKDSFVINLFPIGSFEFPKKKLDQVYEILNIVDTAKPNFKNMFQFCIPVANIYYNPILIEGPQKGNIADKGLESFYRIYEIRKAFFEAKFYRIEI